MKSEKNNILKPGQSHECTSCGMCSAVCPTGAIDIKLSVDGFYRPFIDMTKCINCGKCLKTCYKYDETFKSNVPNESEVLCVSAKNKNKEELKLSSSGGVSIELMRTCLNMGYLIVGVAYDYTQECAVTKIAATMDELRQFQGSKYFQSYTATAFRQIVSDHSTQKYAIFGTPCQIYAFAQYAEMTHQQDRFLLVDIFCHGCPSFLVWDKYLTHMKAKLGTEKFDEIRFRSKSNGWHEFCFDFIHAGKKHVSSKFKDPFYEMFFSNSVLNGACYDCVARSSIEKADIRIGDFWGFRFDMDVEGVSAAVIRTPKGRHFFEKIADKFYLSSVDFNEVIREQSYGKSYDISADTREKSIDKLKNAKTIMEAEKKNRSYIPRSTRIKNNLKMVLKCIPKKLYMRIRLAFHK